MAKKIRIRKLTERECFRLMGVRDSDIDKIQEAEFTKDSVIPIGYSKKEDRSDAELKKLKIQRISSSQQYKMAENSIVVNVLDGVFENMIYPQKEEDLLF